MKYKQLTREQRYGIYLGLQEGKTKKAIAQQVGVHASTIIRELKRNSGKTGRYGWSIAHEKALERRERLPGNRSLQPSLLEEAKKLILTEQWSPRQISGALSLEGKKISHESIYRMIRRDESGRLASQCRHKMKYRRHRRHLPAFTSRSIPNRISIHDRPPEANGKRFGDWEMDLIIGKKERGAILTLIERSTNLLIMRKLKQGKKAEPLAKLVGELLFPYKAEAVKTITTDNGSEFARHEKITQKTGAPVFFTDTYASWQKGAIENTNKLIRQYIPKGVSFDLLSEQDIRMIQNKLNRRPRQKLDFSTPIKEFAKHF